MYRNQPVKFIVRVLAITGIALGLAFASAAPSDFVTLRSAAQAGK